MKRLFLLLSAVSFSSVSLATLSPFDGFYVGVAGGGVQTATDVQHNASAAYYFSSNPNTFGVINNSFSTKVHQNSGIGALYLGYGQKLGQSPLYFGIDIFGDTAQHDFTVSQGNNFFAADKNGNSYNISLGGTVKTELNSGEYGIDARPGVLLNQNTLLYGRVGAAFNRLQVNATDTHNLAYINVNFQPQFGTTATTTLATGDSKNVTGLRLGVGLEERWGNHFAVNADYIYTNYGKINLSGLGSTNQPRGFDPAAIPNSFHTNTILSDVTSQAVMIGVAYYFLPGMFHSENA